MRLRLRIAALIVSPGRIAAAVRLRALMTAMASDLGDRADLSLWQAVATERLYFLGGADRITDRADRDNQHSTERRWAGNRFRYF